MEKRLPRFKRVPIVAPILLTERDRHIIHHELQQLQRSAARAPQTKNRRKKSPTLLRKPRTRPSKAILSKKMNANIFALQMIDEGLRELLGYNEKRWLFRSGDEFNFHRAKNLLSTHW